MIVATAELDRTVEERTEPLSEPLASWCDRIEWALQEDEATLADAVRGFVELARRVGLPIERVLLAVRACLVAARVTGPYVLVAPGSVLTWVLDSYYEGCY